MTLHEETGSPPKTRRRFWPLLALGIVYLTLATPARAQDARGKAEEVRDGAWVTRQDQQLRLAAGMDIQEFDIVKTDSTGFVLIRFLDESVLELKANTTVAIKEVVASEKRNRFDVGLMEGTARVVTGMIVKKNPRGFKITTPKSTVGIRGTTLTVFVNPADGQESVAVERLTEGRGVEVSYRETGIVRTLAASNSSVSLTQSGAITQVGKVFEGPVKGPESRGTSGESGRGDRPAGPSRGASDPCRDGDLSSPPGNK